MLRLAAASLNTPHVGSCRVGWGQDTLSCDMCGHQSTGPQSAWAIATERLHVVGGGSAAVPSTVSIDVGWMRHGAEASCSAEVNVDDE